MPLRELINQHKEVQPASRDYETLLDTLRTNPDSKEAKPYVDFLKETLKKARLSSGTIEIRAPRTNDGRSYRGAPSTPLGIAIIFDLISRPRAAKNPVPHGFIGPLTERERSAQNNPTGAAFLKALGVDPVHADQVNVGIKEIDGRFVRDDTEPDGYRYEGGAFVTGLSIPFHSAALGQILEALDYGVFKQRVENSMLNRLVECFPEDTRKQLILMIKENEEAPKIKALLDQPLPADETANVQETILQSLQAVSDWFGTLLPQAETKRVPGGNDNTFSLT